MLQSIQLFVQNATVQCIIFLFNDTFCLTFSKPLTIITHSHLPDFRLTCSVSFRPHAMLQAGSCGFTYSFHWFCFHRFGLGARR